MGWIIFGCYLVYGLIMNIIYSFREGALQSIQIAKDHGETKWLPQLEKEYKRVDLAFSILLGIGIAALAILILYCLGWVWYYFCSGFLVFEEQSFFERVMCGLISLIPLGLIIGLIAIMCGWNPR